MTSAPLRVPATSLHTGDLITCDYLPIRTFSPDLTSGTATPSGAVKWLRTIHGAPAAATTGSAVTDRTGVVITTLIPRGPLDSLDELTLSIPVVRALYDALDDGHIIMLTAPAGTTRVDVSVKLPQDPPATVARLADPDPTSIDTALLALVGAIPASDLIAAYRSPTISPRLQEVISRLFIEAAITP